MNDSVLRIIFGQMQAAFPFIFTLYGYMFHFGLTPISVIISAFHIFKFDMWIICWLIFTNESQTLQLKFSLKL